MASGLATCGVISARGSLHSGWPSGSGSGSVTSSAAPADRARGERRHQRVGVDQRAAGDVDQPGVLAHRRQLGGADQVARGGRRRRGDHDEVGARPDLVDALDRERAVAAAARHRDDLDAERLEQLDQRAPDAAGADQRHRRARQLARSAAASRSSPARTRAAAARRPASAPARARRPAARTRRRPTSTAARGRSGRASARSPRTAAAPTAPGRAARRGTRPGSNPPTPARRPRSSGPISPPAARTASSTVGVGLGRDVDGGRHACEPTPPAMASVPLLSARDLKKSFGGRLILDGLDLELADGMRVGVLGPNGGGKSTLLRILAGVEHADAGTVTRRRGLVHAFLPQNVPGDERTALGWVPRRAAGAGRARGRAGGGRAPPRRSAAGHRPRRDGPCARPPGAAAGALGRAGRRPRRVRGAQRCSTSSACPTTPRPPS